MKKVLQSIAVCASLLVATTVNAQLPDNGIYPGGLILESYTPSAGYAGNHIYTMGTWDIDSILDSGTPVILDLFATWCGPCWSYHQAGTLENLYDSEGWGGSGNVAIFAVESDGSTVASKLEGGDQGDWINDTKYPMVNHDQVAGMMNLAYYPTIIMICPDRTVTEVGQTTEANFITAMQACAAPATATNDPRIISNATASSVVTCGGGAANVDIKVTVQNYSTAAINAMYTIEAYDASNTMVASTNATLNLASYAAEEVTIGTVSLSATTTYSVKITTANDDLTNDEITGVTVVLNAAQTMSIANNEVTLNMDLDDYASEVGVVFDAGLPTSSLVTTYNNANNGTTTPIGFMAVSTMSNGDVFPQQQYTVSGIGCHYFAFIDTYGDGIVYQNSTGKATITTPTGASLDIPGNWGDGRFVILEFTQGVSNGIESNNLENLTIYPNPASTVANVSLTLTQASDVTINVVNTLGQTVTSNSLGYVNGAQTAQINTSNLEAGIYLVNIIVDGATTTKRISVLK